MKDSANRRQDPFAVLDLGADKICCLIGRRHEKRIPELIGVGVAKSRGIVGGQIVEFEPLQAAITTAVQQAEKMAGVSAVRVVVNLIGAHLNSCLLRCTHNLPKQVITARDVAHLFQDAQTQARRYNNDWEIVHALPVDYTLDGRRGILDPCGMSGRKLSLRMHALFCSGAELYNLDLCLRQCYFELSSVVPAGYASALACLSADEMELGVTLLDIGAQTTAVAVFRAGQLVFADHVPMGGGQITSDVARGLVLGYKEAERLKKNFGCQELDDQAQLEFPSLGAEVHAQAPMRRIKHSELTKIIRARVEEIGASVHARLEAHRFGDHRGSHLVLTGGTSALDGLAEVIEGIFDCPVRLAVARSCQGLIDSVAGPAHTMGIGLLHYALLTNSSCTAQSWSQRLRLTPQALRGRLRRRRTLSHLFSPPISPVRAYDPPALDTRSS